MDEAVTAFVNQKVTSFVVVNRRKVTNQPTTRGRALFLRISKHSYHIVCFEHILTLYEEVLLCVQATIFFVLVFVLGIAWTMHGACLVLIVG